MGQCINRSTACYAAVNANIGVEWRVHRALLQRATRCLSIAAACYGLLDTCNTLAAGVSPFDGACSLCMLL
jgi:hypothetical protein